MTYTSPLPVTDGRFYEGSELRIDNLVMAYGDVDVIRDVAGEAGRTLLTERDAAKDAARGRRRRNTVASEHALVGRDPS